jgi:RNA polymerase sigma factor (sigma-70 family)
MFTVEGIITIPEKRPVDGSIDRIVHSTKGRLFGFIRSRVNDIEDAEDILQDVFYQLAAADPEEQITEASSWLFTVARNKITDWYRKKKTQPFSGLLSDEGELPEFEDRISLLPDQALEESLFREAMMEALDELPAAQRDVFIMHEIEGIPYEEIARITGEKVNTLLSRKRYAVKYLQERLVQFK